MPKKRPERLLKYDLKKKFTSVSGSVYFSSGDPTEHLILWARAATKDAVPTTAEDASSGGHTVAFQDGPTSDEGALNQTAHTSPFSSLKLANVNSAVRFPKNANAYVKVNDADDLSFGNGSADSSFSIATWVQITSASSTVGLVQKGLGTVGSPNEYKIFYHDGDLTGSLSDVSASAALNFLASPGALFTEDAWHHVAFTYNASLTKTGRGKFYFDGKFASGSCIETGTYVAMEAGGAELRIAENMNNQPMEFMQAGIWTGKVLSAEDINALYNASKGIKDVAKQRVYVGSTGITSLPVRPYLQSIDNATGSYPTTYRLGDSRTGHYSSSFDDTSAIRFQKQGTNSGLSAQVTLGQQLRQGSQYSGSLVVAPNSLPDLALTSSATSVIPGVSDARVRFTPGEDYTPFVESGQFAASMAGTPDPFWATGSLPREVGPGLSNPVWSKTKIEIDLNPTVPTVITFSTGSAYTQSANLYGTRGGINSGLAYYNFDLNRWEIHGDFYTGSNVDYFSEVPTHQTGALLAFSPSYLATGYAALKRSDGHPTDRCGFPFASKFNPTGSQQLPVENLIKYPFLVEKMAYEFSGSLPYIDTTSNLTNIVNFFIMNEPAYNLQGLTPESITRSITGQYDGASSAFTVNGYGSFGKIFSQSQTVNRIRDLVTYAMISAYNSTTVSRGYKEIVQRDLNFQYNSISAIPTGSFIVSASIRSPLPSEGMGILLPRDQGFKLRSSLLKNSYGGRTGTSLFDNGLMISPRSFTDAVVALEPSGSFVYDPSDGVGTDRNLLIPLNEKTSEVSPYLIMPGDKLTFGWANQKQPAAGSRPQDPDEAEIAGHGPNVYDVAQDGRLTIAPGKGKLVLYGSMLRDGKEFHQGLNQHLTSDAVHESIQSSDIKSTPDCIDQWDSDYYFSLSGSYVDYVVEGIKSRKPTVGAGRLSLVPHSVIAGQAGTTGSILRGVRLVDLNERYLDSLFVDPQVVAQANNNKFRVLNSALGTTKIAGIAFYPMGSPSAGGNVTQPDKIWPRSYPFDDRYGGLDLKRVSSPSNPRIGLNDLINDGAEVGPTLRGKILKNLSVIAGPQDSGDASTKVNTFLDFDGGSVSSPLSDQNREFLKFFFGFGDSIDYGLPKVFKNIKRGAVNANFTVGHEVEIRGFKYGLISALPTFTSAVYRRDRFGQARDMFEQRQYSAFEKHRFEMESPNPRDNEGERKDIPGQLASAVSIEFKKVSATGEVAEILPLTNTDFENIKALTKNNLRGVWGRGCNTDPFARSQRPYFDSNPLFPSGSFSQQGEEKQVESMLNDLNQGSILSDITQTTFGS